MARSAVDSSSSSSNLPTQSRATILDLPDELLTCIAEHCTHKTTLKSLQLVAKRFDPLCKAFIWQSVKIDGDFEYHDLQMTHLVANGLIPLVQELNYTVPSVFSALSAHHLSTFSTLETLVLYPAAADAEDEEEGDEITQPLWPKAITDALARLPSLRDLTLRDGCKLEDPSFTLAQHLPFLHTFTSDRKLEDLSSLFEGGPTLRFLDVPLNETGITAASACVRTLETLALRSCSLNRPVWRRLVHQLGALFDSQSNAGRPCALGVLAIDDLDLGPLEDVPELLRSLQSVNLTTLRVTSIPGLGSSASPRLDFKHAVALPAVRKLEIHGASYSHGFLALDEGAVRQLNAFIGALPELTQLTLAFWVLPVTPIELVKLSLSDLSLSAPAYSALLEFLRGTKVTELVIDWRSPLSEYWGWSARLRFVGDVFVGEAFDSEGLSQSA